MITVNITFSISMPDQDKIKEYPYSTDISSYFLISAIFEE